MAAGRRAHCIVFCCILCIDDAEVDVLAVADVLGEVFVSELQHAFQGSQATGGL
jgi:hypothetical protein